MGVRLEIRLGFFYVLTLEISFNGSKVHLSFLHIIAEMKTAEELCVIPYATIIYHSPHLKIGDSMVFYPNIVARMSFKSLNISAM